MNLALTGYRAVGKTTVARFCALELGWDWVDTDVEVELRAGKSIAAIFAEDGEAAFRDLEATVVAQLCERERLVLALGGGAVLRPETRELLKTKARVAWLLASAAEIHERMQADATSATRRPSLTAKRGLAEIETLLAEREPIYRDVADFTVRADDKSPADVATAILAWFRAA